MEFFNNIVLKVDNSGYIRTKFICQKCGKSVSDPADFIIPCTPAGIPLYHLTKFTCKDCCEDEKDQAIMDKLLENKQNTYELRDKLSEIQKEKDDALELLHAYRYVCMGMTPEEVGEAIKEYNSKKG